MIKLKQAVIVEGRYDKIKLSSLIDTLIIETNGFGIFKDKEKCELIKKLAATRGIIIFTDSDSAGLLIRNYLKNIIKDGEIYQAYIPEILGKERRKQKPGAEGLLGVEGVEQQILLDALKRTGIEENCENSPSELTFSNLYSLGISGKANSSEKRKYLLKQLNLPTNLKGNNLLKVLQTVTTCDEIQKILNNYNKGEV